MVDGVHHLYDCFALMNGFLLAILSDDSQFALHQDTVVHYGVVVPSQLLSGGEHILDGYQLRTALEIVGQFYAIPALTGTNQLCLFYFSSLCFAGFSLLTRRQHTETAGEGGGQHHKFHFIHFLLCWFVKQYFSNLFCRYLLQFAAKIQTFF